MTKEFICLKIKITVSSLNAGSCSSSIKLTFSSLNAGRKNSSLKVWVLSFTGWVAKMVQVRVHKRGKTFSYIFEAGKVDGKRKVVEKGQGKKV